MENIEQYFIRKKQIKLTLIANFYITRKQMKVVEYKDALHLFIFIKTD